MSVECLLTQLPLAFVDLTSSYCIAGFISMQVVIDLILDNDIVFVGAPPRNLLCIRMHHDLTSPIIFYSLIAVLTVMEFVVNSRVSLYLVVGLSC